MNHELRKTTQPTERIPLSEIYRALPDYLNQTEGQFDLQASLAELHTWINGQAADTREALTIRTLLAQQGALMRGALSFILDAEDDIEVVAEIGRFDDIVDAALRHRPHVTVLDLDLVPAAPGRSSADLPGLWALHRTLAGSNVLVLAETRQALALGPIMASQQPGLSFLAKDGPPERLVTAVRKIADGELVLDPELMVSAQRTRTPLTPREAQVLSVAAEGAPVREIADRLALTPATVRNHLSRVNGKTGARTRIEAVRMAQNAGWIPSK